MGNDINLVLKRSRTPSVFVRSSAGDGFMCVREQSRGYSWVALVVQWVSIISQIDVRLLKGNSIQGSKSGISRAIITISEGECCHFFTRHNSSTCSTDNFKSVFTRAEWANCPSPTVKATVQEAATTFFSISKSCFSFFTDKVFSWARGRSTGWRCSGSRGWGCSGTTCGTRCWGYSWSRGWCSCRS